LANKEALASGQSLYAQYLFEREGFECVEELYGFATFKVTGDECYLRDIFVIPSMRKQRGASNLCDQVRDIAKARGCKFVVGSVAPSARGSNESIKAILAYGFQLFSSQQDFIIFKLDI
jgi:hypothetical protein